jgi:hypothetical protein
VKKPLLTLLFAASLASLAGQEGFYGFVLPRFSLPLENSELFGPGGGAEVSAEWLFLDLNGRSGKSSGFPLPTLGLRLSGGLSVLTVKDGSTLSLLEAHGGPRLSFPLGSRFELGLGGSAGIYRLRLYDENETRFRWGGDLALAWKLNPALALTLGAGYFRYQYFRRPLTGTFTLAAGLRLNLAELFRPLPRIEVEKIEQYRIFPVSYAWYEKNPLAKAALTNREKTAITDVSLSFFMERFMNEPSLVSVIPRLAPGETAEVPVTAIFNESMLDLTGNISGASRLLISYRILGSARSAEFPIEMPIFHRNAMAWDDDRRAACFVSPQDPAAQLFARYTGSVSDQLLRNNIPGNIQYALALLEALELYGMSYIVDPASSYAELSENESALDSLNYPGETLAYRGGDCDDLSILFCSMLEALKIDTAFITIPGHIYMAFDSGFNETNAPGPAAKDLLIFNEGRYWAPLEVTILNRGFLAAWRTGINQWKAAASPALLPMKDSWPVYQPVSLPAAPEQTPNLPGETELTRRINEALNSISGIFTP